MRRRDADFFLSKRNHSPEAAPVAQLELELRWNQPVRVVFRETLDVRVENVREQTGCLGTVTKHRGDVLDGVLLRTSHPTRRRVVVVAVGDVHYHLTDDDMKRVSIVAAA